MSENTMEQLALFPEAGQSQNLPANLLEYIPGFIDQPTSDKLLEKFIIETPWKQTKQKLWDKEFITPRLTCWYGDKQRIQEILPWSSDLLSLKQIIEPSCNINFNSVLLNYYRDGNDSVAWHSDKESIMGSQPIIASLSLGQVRSFDIRNKKDHSAHYSVKQDLVCPNLAKSLLNYKLMDLIYISTCVFYL